MDKIAEWGLYLDLTPDDTVRIRKRSWWGVALTLVCYGFVLVMAAYFFSLLVTEVTVRFTNTKTLGQTYGVRFRCVSIGGCNVTNEYMEDGACGHLAHVPGSNYSFEEDFVLEICGTKNPKEGVRIATVFDRNKMWLENNVLWSVEMYQDGDYIPVGEVEQNRVKIFRLHNTAIVDSSKFGKRSRVVDSFWAIEPTGSILFDSKCYIAGTPGGFICGSIQFTLAYLFGREEKTLTNTVRADFMAPTFSVLTGSAIIMSVIVLCVRSCRKKDESKSSNVV